MPSIGIDALALAVPESYLDLADLAAVEAFAHEHGLTVAGWDRARRSVELVGRPRRDEQAVHAVHDGLPDSPLGDGHDRRAPNNQQPSACASRSP